MGGKIFVGADSMYRNANCVFACTIAMHDSNQKIDRATRVVDVRAVQSSGGDCCDQLNRSKSSARRVTKENAVKTKT